MILNITRWNNTLSNEADGINDKGDQQEILDIWPERVAYIMK
jgi:hypothetical protein